MTLGIRMLTQAEAIAHEARIDALQQLIAGACQHEAGELVHGAAYQALRWETSVGAWDGSQLVGMLLAHWRNPDPQPQSRLNGDFVYERGSFACDHLVVDSAYRRQRIGTRLLHRWFETTWQRVWDDEHARADWSIETNGSAATAAVHAFYTSNDFVPVGQIQRREQTDIVMWRALTMDQVFVSDIAPPEIVVVDYDPSWPQRFEAERSRIAAALGAAMHIEHVGSTAVPGLPAKPIIDIQITADDPDDVPDLEPALEAAGYYLRVREPGHRMFRSPACDVQIHVWRRGSEDEVRHLVFRDWLRTHPEDRDRYAQVKQELATRHWDHMQQYAFAKTDVIADIMERAQQASRSVR